ncbi:RHS repeat-associated core domain-containing protein [Streptomyces sp. NPDC046324]|uniref:RHS repeat-associated core domain-containing protein n=1 Tax=Streptomyces sp. NPDC046324 TaxID=3154915 RepID=UPI00340F5396
MPSRSQGGAISSPAEPGMEAAPKVRWPKAERTTMVVSPAGVKTAATTTAGEVVSLRTVTPSALDASPSGVAQVAPKQATVRILDDKEVKRFGGVGLGLMVVRADGGSVTGAVEASIDYSGFARAYGGAFASRLRLVKLPACALTTPQASGCSDGKTVKAQRNDTASGRITAVVEAVPEPSKFIKVASAQPAVYALASGSSSDAGDYRASPTNPAGKWDVSLGSGAFTYQVPISVPKPPVGIAPDLALTYNSQSVDGRTSASNNQASWVGMGWDLNVGAIERKYRNCAQDGHPTFGDLCWDSPNSTADPNGAAYTITIDGLTSDLIQDNTGTGAFRIKDDPGWKVQKLNGGYGSDGTSEFWVLTKQDGTRYYFGWGRTERLNNASEREATNSVFTVPVIGDDTGEPCHAQYPSPCTQAWRWSLDRVVTANEVENSYFYRKERNYYRSVAAADKARPYDAGGYLERIDYGWSSQIPGAQLPAMVDFQHVNRCVERLNEPDPLNNTPADCPSIDSKPESYPDVPVDLICDGSADDSACRGKTYYPTFFQRDLLWDINVYVRDKNTDTWADGLVRQYQFKYALMNPSGSVGDQLWLDYIQRRNYSGTDIDLPTINFNGEWQDNKVGTGEMNFRRVNKIFTDTGSTITATYGHATDADGTIDRQCPEAGAPSQSSNNYECFWQKWIPEGATDAKSGWFKKFVTTRVQVDPGKADDGSPSMITDYEYDGAPGWKFSDDPVTDDEDESWNVWRGYGKVLVTTGANENRHSTYHWLYRGLSGDRTSKTDPGATRTVKVVDSDNKEWEDHAWLNGRTLETSTRDHNGDSHKREWHEYWQHNTAQYTGLPDARMVRESKVRTLEKVVNSTDGTGWREHIVENEFDEAEKASTVFGLPMRVDDWGESGVSDNRCTEYGRAYNTGELDATGTQRWMVYKDDERHYSVSCNAVADDEATGTPAAHMDSRTVTFYDGAVTFDENNTKLTDGNPTQSRTYTSETAYRTTRKSYDEAGRVTASWDGKNNMTITAYQPATSWPVDGVKVTTPDPDGAGPATALSRTTFYSRYFGQPWKTVDPNGNATYVVFDAAGRTSKVFKPTEAAAYPDGNPSLIFEYSIPVATSATGVPRVATGDPIRVKSRTLQSGTTYADAYAYADGLGRARESQIQAPSGTGRTVTVTRYDSSGNVAGTSAPFYNSSAPGSGLVNPSVSNIPSYTDTKSDWAGRTILSQLQAKGVVQTANRTVTQYQGADEKTVFPAAASPTKTVTDVFGQTLKVVENLGAAQYSTTYEYTRTGKLKYIHDSLGNTTHYTYNWAGDRLTTEDPDTGTSSTVYDENGKPATVTDPTGVLAYAYDAMGRPTSVKQGSTLVHATSYDTATGGKGQVAVVTTYSGGFAYASKVNSYDARMRETSKTLVVPDDGSGLNGSYTVTYGYDLADNPTSVQYPSVGGLPAETVTSSYTEGLLTGISSPLESYLSSVVYDDYGRVAGRSLGAAGTATSTTRTFTYDDSTGTGWLKNVSTNKLTGGVMTKVQDDTYTRNDLSAVIALRENVAGQQQCFQYDDLQRLTAAWTTAAVACGAQPQSDFAGPSPYQATFAYDQLGNIQSVTEKASESASALTRDYKYPGYNADETVYTPGQARPHAVIGVVTPSGTDTLNYNDAGRMTTRTVGGVASVVGWDPQGRVESITQKKSTGDEVSRYVYNGGGSILMRRTKAENVLYFEGHELHRAAANGSVLATRYYTAKGTSLAMRTSDPAGGNGKLTWLLSDGQASTQLSIAASDGAVTRRRTTPFGAPRSATDNLAAASDRGFLGKPEDDSTGLDILGPRLYDPALGRFLSSDPLTTPYVPQTVNAYSYSGNNPVSFSDPTGYESCYPHYCSGSNGTTGKYKPERDPASNRYSGSRGSGGASSSRTATAPHFCDGCTPPLHVELPEGVFAPAGGSDVVYSNTTALAREPFTDTDIAYSYNGSGVERQIRVQRTVQQIESATEEFTKKRGGSLTLEGGAEGEFGIFASAQVSVKIVTSMNSEVSKTRSKTKTKSKTWAVDDYVDIKQGEQVGISPTGVMNTFQTVYQHSDGRVTSKTWGWFQQTEWAVYKYSEVPDFTYGTPLG